MKGKKTDKKRRYQGIYNRYTKKIQRNFVKSRVNGTLNVYRKLQVYDSIDFENLTGKFWIKKHPGIIIL